MRAGPAAVCPGQVWHRRARPAEHEFTYDTSHVWIDPDRPEDLCRHHRRWSAHRPDVVRFRRSDYGHLDGPEATRSLGRQARADLTPVLGHTPAGPVRMVTQLRRWGWLFNPLTVYLVWDDNPDRPCGLVLEVTNTPWHERHRYPLALAPADESGTGPLTARFDKTLHVSPFLGLDYRYDLRLADRDDRVELALDVIDAGDRPVVTTMLSADRVPADSTSLARATWRPVLPTHRVSLGIHVQAARLWLKRVPIVPHPGQRGAQR